MDRLRADRKNYPWFIKMPPVSDRPLLLITCFKLGILKAMHLFAKNLLFGHGDPFAMQERNRAKAELLADIARNAKGIVASVSGSDHTGQGDGR